MAVSQSKAEMERQYYDATLGEFGVWSYNAGTGSGSDTNAGRIVGVTVMAPPTTDGWFQIGSMPAITVPANATVDFEPRGLTTAAVQIVASASWIVERVQ